jgi:hypothetical protein
LIFHRIKGSQSGYIIHHFAIFYSVSNDVVTSILGG